MAYMDKTPSLSAVRDLLLPSIWATQSRAGKRVLEAGLDASIADDAINLHVKHRLFDRCELEDNSYKYKLADRLYEAMLVKAPTSKSLRVERRRLHWRGETARKGKPRKIIEDKA